MANVSATSHNKGENANAGAGGDAEPGTGGLLSGARGKWNPGTGGGVLKGAQKGAPHKAASKGKGNRRKSNDGTGLGGPKQGSILERPDKKGVSHPEEAKELKEVNVIPPNEEPRTTAETNSPRDGGGDTTTANMVDMAGKKPQVVAPAKNMLQTLPAGAVGRRAPLNPFSSPMLGKYRKKKKNAKQKVADPRLNNNPLTGRLIVCISTTAILFWVFLAQMVFNFNTFNGRCISKVLYPIYTTTDTYERRPYIISLGYSSCEYNLDEKAEDRHFVGSGAADSGWPSSKVEPIGDGGKAHVSWDSVNSRTYTLLGGLDTNLIRNYGEVYRLFWSMYLHGGFMHIIFNIVCQIQILWMIEPDWGFIRTMLLFFITGVTGNLLSAVCDPCSVTVGSSGALYGLIGALFTYCIEYWKTIPRPCCVLVFMIAVIIFGILMGMFDFTDNYAHMGGCLAGILYGFATITTVSAADKCTLGERMLMSPPFSWFLSDESKQLIEAKAKEKKIKGELYRKKKLENKVHKDDTLHLVMAIMKNRLNEEGRPPCKMKAREWIVRITAAVSLLLMWIVLFTYLLNEKAYTFYTPPGQIRFSGIHQCYCCRINVSNSQLKLPSHYWCFARKEDAEGLCD